MSCEICQHDSSVDSILWNCVGCSRVFHAACVGVPVQRNSLRKRDKHTDVLAYIIPCCSACQSLISLSFDFKQLEKQQADMVAIINKNTEIIHRTNHQNNVSVIHEAIDRIECQLVDIKKELNTQKLQSATAIKNHLTSLMYISMQAAKGNISGTMKTVTSSISSGLINLNDEIKQLSYLTMDKSVNAATHSRPLLELDILDELKSISANIATKYNSIAQHTTKPNCYKVPYTAMQVTQNNCDTADTSGWRLLGAKKVWKMDWTEYDLRKQRRVAQEKKAERARKRKKHALRNQSSRAYPQRTHEHSHNPNSSRRGKFRGPQFDINNNNNYSKASKSIFYDYNRNSSHPLPPDRELLAEAKYRFARPPRNHQPILFRSGEVLNPYPKRSSQRGSSGATNIAMPRTPPDFRFRRSSQRGGTGATNIITTPRTPQMLCSKCSCKHSGFRRN